MSTNPAAFNPTPAYQPASDPFSDLSQIAAQQRSDQQAAQQVTQPARQSFKYFPAPPLITTYHQYQDVNNDNNLQYNETIYFLDKTLDWIKHDKSFKNLKKFEKNLKGSNGYEIMHKLLKLFVKRGNTNWYDLKVQQSLVKAFIKHKLSKL